MDDEDASDRLVIDEGQDVLNANSPTSAPQCQGCLQKPAQFVCAGCGNQWYCSKDCQVCVKNICTNYIWLINVPYASLSCVK